jgi:hypothetical protein
MLLTPFHELLARTVAVEVVRVPRHEVDFVFLAE